MAMGQSCGKPTGALGSGPPARSARNRQYRSTAALPLAAGGALGVSADSATNSALYPLIRFAHVCMSHTFCLRARRPPPPPQNAHVSSSQPLQMHWLSDAWLAHWFSVHGFEVSPTV